MSLGAVEAIAPLHRGTYGSPRYPLPSEQSRLSPRDTPDIPDWIRNFRDTREPARFLNVFDEDEFPPAWRLHDAERPALLANESMYGRWSDARVLILARDAGTKWNFIPVIQGGRGFSWVHDEARPTNRNLRPYADSMKCSKLYGSAMSCLVLNSPKPSDGSKAKERVKLRPLLDERCRQFVSRVLRWTLEHTPQLELVICLGEDSWDLTMNAFDIAVPPFAAVRGRAPRSYLPDRPRVRFGVVGHTGNHFDAGKRPVEWAPFLEAAAAMKPAPAHH